MALHDMQQQQQFQPQTMQPVQSIDLKQRLRQMTAGTHTDPDLAPGIGGFSSDSLQAAMPLASPSTQMRKQSQQSNTEALQDDFTLLDVIGGAGLSVLHPTKPIVAYTSGCIIIVFDLMSDTKIQLTAHEHEVHALAFTPAGAGGMPGQGGDYLISIDFNRNEPNQESGPLSRMLVWDWRQGTVLQQVRLPSSHSPAMLSAQHLPAANELRGNKQLRFFEIVFAKQGSTFMVLESCASDGGGGYRASFWNFNRADSIGLVSHEDLDLQQRCFCLCILDSQTQQTTLANPMYNTATGKVTVNRVDGNSHLAQVYLTNTIKFLTVEKFCIKIWEISQGAFELKKRIHIKQAIKQCVISELTNFMLILGMNGKVLILDSQGEFVSTVSQGGAFFTEIGTCDDRLLLGTERGTVQVYHIASLHFIAEIPYQLALLPNNCLNEDLLKATREAAANRPLNKTEEALRKIGPPVSGIMATRDKRFLMVKYGDSSFAVIDRKVVTSPSDAILGYQQGHFESITGLQWMSNQSAKMGAPILPDQTYLIHQSAECFATCSADLSVYVWRHFGDRWQAQYIDIAKCIDPSLTYQRKACDQSTASLRLTALQILPRRQTLAVADNRGTLRIFEISSEQATLVSTHHLQKSPEMLGDQSTFIQSIYFTEDEQVAVITFDTGLISAYDVRGGFTWLGDIEKEVPRLNQLAPDTLAKVLERNDARNDPNGGHLINQFIARNTQETRFSVFSLRGPNCVKYQLVEVKDNRLGMTPLAQFFIDEGKVAGFEVHPSKDYILITSSRGKIYVFRIDTGELRGTIDVPLHAQGCLIDPSGLYVVIRVPPFSPRHTSNLTNYVEDFGTVGINERDLCRTTILMYELGTCRVAAEVHSIFDIAQMNYSSDGRYLALASQRGAVSVWALGDHQFRGVHEVIERMREQPDFWCNYPIYLPDHTSQATNVNRSSLRGASGGVDSRQLSLNQQAQQPYDELKEQKLSINQQLEQLANQLPQQQQNQQQPYAPQHQDLSQAPAEAEAIWAAAQQMYEVNQDQTPLRQKPMNQMSIIEQTDKANFNDSQPVNERLQEVTMHSQDLQPSHYAAQNKANSGQGNEHAIDEMSNAQRFMRDQEPMQANRNQQKPLSIEVPKNSYDQSKPTWQTPRSFQNNRDQNQMQSPLEPNPLAEQPLESATQRDPPLSDNLAPENKNSASEIPREQAIHPDGQDMSCGDNQSRSNGVVAQSCRYSDQQQQPQRSQQMASQGPSRDPSAEAMSHMESLYRRQQPHVHPLRGDHDYVQYLNQQKAIRQEAAAQRQQQVPQNDPEYEAFMAYDGYSMPSANQIMKSQSMQKQRPPQGYQNSMVTPPQKFAQTAQTRPADPGAIISSWTPHFKNEMHYNRQVDPADIDAQVTPRQARQKYMGASAPPQQMYYTDDGVLVPQRQDPQPPQNYRFSAFEHNPGLEQQYLSFGEQMQGTYTSLRGSQQMPMARPPTYDHEQQQQQRLIPQGIHDAPPSQPSQRIRHRSKDSTLDRTYQEVDDFEARMRMGQSFAASQRTLMQDQQSQQRQALSAFPIDPAPEQAAAVQNYAKSLIGTMSNAM